jgi:hypothetical protein
LHLKRVQVVTGVRQRDVCGTATDADPERPLRAAGAHDQATETREITPYKWVHSPFDDPHRADFLWCPVTPGRDECWAPQYFPTIWRWNAVATALQLRML